MIKQLKSTIQLVLIQVLVIFICIEITLRLFGGKPFQIEPYTIKSTPDFCLICKDRLGIGLNPGTYQVSINKKVNYSCTTGLDSLRITSYSPIDTSSKKTLDIHGCSFAYGMSIDDSLTYPFLLQQQFSNTRVRNFAVPGYGTLQTLLILQEQIKTGDLPNAIILNYAGFHEERNVFSPNYRISLHHGFKNAHQQINPLFSDCDLPYVQLNEAKNKIILRSCKWSEIYKNWRFREISSTINFIQTTYDDYSSVLQDEHKATILIIEEIKNICDQYDIQLSIALMTMTDKDARIESYARQSKIPTIRFSIDLSTPEYTNLPYDIHPNAKAHKAYFEQVLLHLRK